MNKRIPELLKSISIIMDAIPGPKLCQNIIFKRIVIGIKKILKTVNINANLAAKVGILVLFLIIVFKASFI